MSRRTRIASRALHYIRERAPLVIGVDELLAALGEDGELPDVGPWGRRKALQLALGDLMAERVVARNEVPYGYRSLS